VARKKARSYRTFAQADKLRILQEADACTVVAEPTPRRRLTCEQGHEV
jgi:hypothetical protein